jgi:hypothetical protein
MMDGKKKPQIQDSPVWTRLIIGLYAAALLSYIGLGLFSRMMADDFCTAAIGSGLNPFEATQQWYLTWSGLYTNFFIKSAIAPLEPFIHPFLTGIFILGIFGILWCVIRDVLRWQNVTHAGWAAVLLSGALTFGVVDGAVSRQPIFWAGALIPYALPLILLVGALGLAFRLIFTTPSLIAQIVMTVGLALLAFFIAGFSEVYAVYEGALWGLLLLAGTFVLWQQKDKRVRLWGVMGLAIIVTIIGLVIVLKSPGNEIRRAAQDQALILNNPIELGTAILQFAVSIFTVESYGLVHFFLIFFASLALWLTLPGDQDLASFPAPRNLIWAFVLSFLGAFALVIVAVTPPMYGAGLVSARTLMAVRFTQLSLFALWGYWTAVGLSRANLMPRLRRSVTYRWVKTAMIITFLAIPGMVLLRHAALVSDFATYAREWDARHTSLIAARDHGDVDIVVAPLDYNLEDYLVLDRMEKGGTLADTQWVYGCVTNYYDVTFKLLNPPVVMLPDKSN